jgi:hypothetical protein
VREHAAAVLIDLHGGHDPDAAPLKREVETSDAGEQGHCGEVRHAAPSGAISVMTSTMRPPG